MCSLGLSESGECEFGGDESVEHVLFECELWYDIRNEFVARLRGKDSDRVGMVCDKGFGEFVPFARSLLEEKERREFEWEYIRLG